MRNSINEKYLIYIFTVKLVFLDLINVVLKFHSTTFEYCILNKCHRLSSLNHEEKHILYQIYSLLFIIKFFFIKKTF